MKYIFYLLLFTLPFAVMAQTEAPSIENDSVKLLSPVLIKGYESGRSLLETPVAVGYISAKDLQRYSNVSLLPSLNTIPGVRMEERSPGSYRLNIRGSLLRSPFGVRNIKVYWNDMPFTDAGGNTYLNLIDPNTVGSIEVLKGPGGSLYGANTGGIVVLHTDDMPLLKKQDNSKDHRFRIQLNGGSYGTFGEQAQWKYRDKNISSSFAQSHLQADGYRVNSRLRKDVLQWNANTLLSKKDKAEWVLLYADLYYQTPGGLTLTQMEQNPRQARSIAVYQKAAIYNKTLFAGLSNTHEFNKHWSNTTSLSFSQTSFKNPFITNYEKRTEKNLGVRSKFVYETKSEQYNFRLVGGAEWLYGSAAIDNYGNKKGVPDTVQLKDRLLLRQWFPFLQIEWQLKKKLLVQAGVSTNSNLYYYKRLTDNDDTKKKINLDKQFLPRLSLLYLLNKNFSAYASVSKGFSPPNREEIRPSGGTINTNLQPEHGWNYELGFRGNSVNSRLQYDVAVYYFRLQQAIVKRENNAGSDYFINAGGTDQKGVEAKLSYALVYNPGEKINLVRLWSGYTYNNYNFTNYIVDSADYSGKMLTGVPKTISVTGLDVNTDWGVYLYASVNHTSNLPLNDANDEFAKAFTLVQVKIGWKKKFDLFGLELFAGADNLLDERYSLGNDINAFGKRYYNPSPVNNYFGGVIVNF
jgi:iron complex outermembrane recepter protein